MTSLERPPPRAPQSIPNLKLGGSNLFQQTMLFLVPTAVNSYEHGLLRPGDQPGVRDPDLAWTPTHLYVCYNLL